MTTRVRARVPALALVAFVASPVPSPSAQAPPSVRLYRVAPGDTLSAIARRYHVTVSSLVAVNSLGGSTTRLKVGSRLAIPDATASEAERQQLPGAVTSPKPTPRTSRLHRAVRVVRMPGNFVLAIPELDEMPGFLWPVEGSVSSTFGRRRNGWHGGLDIVAPAGVAIVAAAPGLVVASGEEVRYGRVVKVLHEHGFSTVYAHNEQNLVELGDWVDAGQTIALLGRTGHATAEHLHFEIRHYGRLYNPLYLLPLPPRHVQVDEHDLDEDHEDE